MSGVMECGGPECSRLRVEVAALEQLVGRYQQELEAASTCRTCSRRAYVGLESIEEEIFEYQRLDWLEWDHTGDGDVMDWAAPRYTRRCGRPCQFNEVLLPSKEWKWTSDWHIDVHSKTDSDGWTYAFSEEDFESDLTTRSDRSAADRARRRRWKRERAYVGSSDLPPSITARLDIEARISELQAANEKLTEQLRRANEQILDYEDRLKLYESMLSARPSVHLAPQQSPTKRQTEQSLAQSATTFSPGKSRDLLNQTEALLIQMLGTSPTRLVEDASEVQRRRSEMVEECQNELDNAVNEFHSHLRTLSGTSASAPAQGS